MTELQQLAHSWALDNIQGPYEVKAKHANGMHRPIIHVYAKPLGGKRGKHIASILVDLCYAS